MPVSRTRLLTLLIPMTITSRALKTFPAKTCRPCRPANRSHTLKCSVRKCCVRTETTSCCLECFASSEHRFSCLGSAVAVKGISCSYFRILKYFSDFILTRCAGPAASLSGRSKPQQPSAKPQQLEQASVAAASLSGLLLVAARRRHS
jgi:hypothetical protein